MSSPNTISGKYMVAAVESSLIVGLQGWTVRETTDQLDGTTGADAGYEDDDFGIVRAEIEMDCVQNLAAGTPYVAIRATTRLTNVRLYRSYGDAQPAFTFPLVTVYESTNMGKVRERLTVNVKAKSNGAYTFTNPGAG